MTPTGQPKSSDATEWPHVVAVGEVLWDMFPDARRLGGAPLNFAANLMSLGHTVSLVSGLGDDALGHEAAAIIAELGLDPQWLKWTKRYPTGTAEITAGSRGDAEFAIPRPAAYDELAFRNDELAALHRLAPGWTYFGTLFAASPGGRRALDSLLEALAGVPAFYDINLRPGADDGALVMDLLSRADVVKLNEAEQIRISELAGLPVAVKPFCRAARDRFGLRALAVTLGARGCALLVDEVFVTAPALKISVADTVGAGDAFAAAFLHGLSRHWTADEIAGFANRRAAAVVGRKGALPELVSHAEASR